MPRVRMQRIPESGACRSGLVNQNFLIADPRLEISLTPFNLAKSEFLIGSKRPPKGEISEQKAKEVSGSAVTPSAIRPAYSFAHLQSGHTLKSFASSASSASFASHFPLRYYPQPSRGGRIHGH